MASTIILSGLGNDFVPGQSYQSTIAEGYSVVPQSNSDLTQMPREVVKVLDTGKAHMGMGKMGSGLSPMHDLAHKAFMVAGAGAILYVLWQKFGKR